MCTAGFPEPLTFSLRARARPARPRRRVRRRPRQPVASAAGCSAIQPRWHADRGDHPPPDQPSTARLELAAAAAAQAADAAPLVRASPRMQARVAPPAPPSLTVSESLRRDIVADFGVPPERHARSSRSASTPDLFQPAGPTAGARAASSWSPAPTSPLKGLVHLLEAVAKLRTERDVELTVVGKPDPAARPSSRRPARPRDAVTVRRRHLRRPSWSTLIARAEVVVRPVAVRGLLAARRRGMACATPLVATDAGALPEVVGDDGAGCGCAPGDVGELAARARAGCSTRRRWRERLGRGRARAGSLERYTLARSTAAAAPPRLVRPIAARRAGRKATAVLTVDYDRLGLGRGMTRARPGLRRGPARLRGLPPRRRRRRRRLEARPRSRRRRAGWARSRGRRGPRRRRGARWSAATCSTCPSPTAAFDRVIAVGGARAHPGRRHGAMAEIVRVLKPGGRARGHRAALRPGADLLGAVGRVPRQRGRPHPHLPGRRAARPGWRRPACVPGASHHAHALHAPYWWLKCAVGVERDTAAVRAYHRLLVWDLTKRPWLTRTAERVLDPLLGKSLVVYADKPAVPQQDSGAAGGGPRSGSGPLPRAEAGELLPELPGVLTGDQVRTTVAWIAAEQDADGALPWFRGGQLDPWDSVEAAMALDVGGEHDRAAGGLPLAGRPAAPRRLLGRRSTGRRETRRAPAAESNHAGYLAVGVVAQLAAHRRRAAGHRAVAGGPRRAGPGDPDAAARRRDRLGAATRRHARRHGPADRQRQPLPGAALRHRAGRRCAARPSRTGSSRSTDLGHARCATSPEAFADRSRFSMDWYYPVLAAPRRRRRPRPGSPGAGTGSSSPGSACAAYRTRG